MTELRGGDQSPVEDIVSRLTSLNQYRASGQRVPHKPLLVLMALGQLATTGSSRLAFSEIEARLASLIAEFGPTSKTPARQSAAYPFTHLRSDGVWALDADVPMDRVSTLAGVSGSFVPSIEQRLVRDPRLLAQVARAVVDTQFPPTLADEVLVAVGLDPEWSFPGATSIDAARIARRRSAAWRHAILADWDGACAFCGYDGSLLGTSVGVEAAHVRWFNFGGPDDPDNGLALCSLHHKLFDRGALGLTPEHRIAVSRSFRAQGVAGRTVYDLHGRALTARPGTVMPAPVHLEWHRTQVFHEPALRAG